MLKMKNLDKKPLQIRQFQDKKNQENFKKPKRIYQTKYKKISEYLNHFLLI
jgi:hypothetical protein